MNSNRFLAFITAGLLLIAPACFGQVLPQTLQNSFVGELNGEDFAALKQFLQQYSNTPLRDTLAIKYDYNHETCWDRLDGRSADDIKRSISYSQNRVRELNTDLFGMSIFRFREEGKSVNKIIKWDSSILIDRDKILYKLLFKKKAICGNSAIVLPDRRFIFIPNDSHMEVLEFTRLTIRQVLAKGNTKKEN
jgi:hypothetical protein